MGRPGGEVAHAMVVGEEAAAADAAVAARKSMRDFYWRRLGHHAIQPLQEGLPAAREICVS